MVSYEFYIGEFFAQEMRDQAIERVKLLLPYLCIMMQLCFSVRVQEIVRVNDLLEPKKIIDLRLIQDIVNPMAR